MNHGKSIIEVNGVKLEVDLRTAKRVDELRVGDRVKVLTKGYQEWEVHAGTVVGFEPFKNLPTVIVAYLKNSYPAPEIKFLYFNAQSKEVEIVKAIDDDVLDLNKANIVQQMDRDIEKKLAEVEELRSKKAYFLSNFKAYWPELANVE